MSDTSSLPLAAVMHAHFPSLSHETFRMLNGDRCIRINGFPAADGWAPVSPGDVISILSKDGALIATFRARGGFHSPDATPEKPACQPDAVRGMAAGKAPFADLSAKLSAQRASATKSLNEAMADLRGLISSAHCLHKRDQELTRRGVEKFRLMGRGVVSWFLRPTAEESEAQRRAMAKVTLGADRMKCAVAEEMRNLAHP